MVDDVMAQMGFGVADEGAEGRMRGIAKKLRGERDLGQFFAFSGSQRLRDAGKGMVDTAGRQIKGIGDRRAQGLTRAAQAARDKETARRNAALESSTDRQFKYSAGQDEITNERNLRGDQQDILDTMNQQELAERTAAQTLRRADREFDYEAGQDAVTNERNLRGDQQNILDTMNQQELDERTAAQTLRKADRKFDYEAGQDTITNERNLREDQQKIIDTMNAEERAERTAAVAERQKLAAAELKNKQALEMQEIKDRAALERAEVSARAKADATVNAAGRMSATEKKNYRIAGDAAAALPRIIEQVEANADAFGAAEDITQYLPGMTPNLITEGAKNYQNQTRTNEQQLARAAVFEEAYKIINDLAGAALSVHEKARIEVFTPAPNDDARTIANKLRSALKTAKRKHESFDMYIDYEALAKAPKAPKVEEVAAVAPRSVEDIQADIDAEIKRMGGQKRLPKTLGNRSIMIDPMMSP